MADGLSTGIALSGQLKVDDSAQQNLLQAERAAAQERMAQKAALDKEQKDLEKEISKSLYMSQNAIQPKNQQKAEQIATSGVASIISGMRKGDLGIADIYREAAAVKSKLNAVTELDKQQTEAFNLYSKDPSSYGKKTVTIKGKDYNSPAEAYNDPALTPKDLADAYGTTEFAVIESPVLGEEILAYSPRKRTSPFEFIQDSKVLMDDNLYTESVQGKPFRLPQYGDETFVSMSRKMNPQAIDGIMGTMLNNAQVLDYYADQARAENPNLKEGTDEMLAEIQRRATAEVLPWLKEQAKRDPDKTFTPTAPKESDSAKNANKHLAGGAWSEDGKHFDIKIPGRDQVARKFQVPKGATYYTGTEGKQEERSTVDAPATIDAQPYKIQWGKSLKDSKIMYQSDIGPDGKESKTGKIYTYEIPVTRQSMNDLAGNFGANYTDWANRIVELSEAGPVEDIKKWLDSLGIDSDGTGGGPDSKSNPKEVERKDPKSGKVAIFDADTKEFIRWK